MKRILIILATLVIVIGLGVAVYFIFFGPSSAHLTVGTSPFAGTSSGVASANPAAPADQVAGNAGTIVAPNLIKITSSPVSGGEVAFDIAPVLAATTTTSLSASTTVSTTTTQTASGADIEVHYVDRQSGNIYAYRAIARSLTRISDKTLPGIQEASWLPDGSLAFVRFLTATNGVQQLQTYALPTNGADGYFLQQGLDEAVVTGSTTLFTLMSSTDNSVGVAANANGTNPHQVFTSPLADLVVHAAGTSYIAVTKAAAELDGYVFSINSSGGFTPIIGPLRGLTALPSPSGKLIAYSYTDGTTFHMGVLNLTTGSITSLPLATLAEKCVWTNDNTALYCAVPSAFSGNLPDDWYQGAVSFTDRIWRIDLTTRLATLVLDPNQVAKTRIDAVNLTLDPQNRLLVFRNKKDSSLWAYSL